MVKLSSFGTEFVALIIATELLVLLRYTLSMFGIPIDSPADFFCENQSVMMNIILPHSLLNKMHNNRVRESQAAEVIIVPSA